MTKGRKLAAVATALVVVLVGCNNITVIPTATFQDGERCMTHSLSADGKWLVYTTLDDRSGQTHPRKTVLRNLSTGATRQLAGDGPFSGIATDTAISGDGSRIVLNIPNLWATSGGLNFMIYLWTSRSGTRTRITPLAESNRASAISADGRKVAYSDEFGDKAWLYDVGTATRKAIARPAGTTVQTDLDVVSISANGRYVVLAGSNRAFVRDTINGTGWTLPTSGYQLKPGVDISGDGRWVAFSLHKPSDPSTRSNVYVWDRTTQKASMLTRSTGQAAAGQVSIDADGSHIAYTTADATTGSYSLRTLDRSTKASTVVASSTRYFGQPSLAANGAKGSFCSPAPGLAPGAKGAPNLYTWG